MNTKQEAPVSAGVWVKASEKMPGKEGAFIVRNIPQSKEEKIYVLLNGAWLSPTGEIHWYNIPPENYFKYEWLDESQPVSVQVEGLREALYDVLYMCKRASFTEHTIPKIMNICEAALSSPSGQEKDAVGFAEWVAKGPRTEFWGGHWYRKGEGNDVPERVTTKDLYTLYLNRDKK